MTSPLPPYTYVPGRNPHPVSHPDGHAYGQEKSDLSAHAVDSNAWSRSERFRRGLFLFTHGYYWESHEEWETLWHILGRNSQEAMFVKGLIKLAAAGVKCLEGNEAGAKRHAARALELLRETRSVWGSTEWEVVAQQVSEHLPVIAGGSDGVNPAPLAGFTPVPLHGEMSQGG
ncbi:MAG: DUF309 domain-containing protein [Planctomycetaceae bacterium]|nr:DUF309 domain-containing protein [Planctomycetaceae bacterium]